LIQKYNLEVVSIHATKTGDHYEILVRVNK